MIIMLPLLPNGGSTREPVGPWAVIPPGRILVRRGQADLRGTAICRLFVALAVGWLLILLLSACAAPRLTQAQIEVTITADGAQRALKVPAGSTVQDALTALGLSLNPLDRSEPPLYTVLTDGGEARLVRVVEEFEVVHNVIAFEQQVLRNETLPEGEQRLIQPGVNGVEEMTYRRVLEDGLEVSNSPIKSLLVKPAVPEIVMIGSQTPFAPVPIPGRLAYLSAGNAWVMESTTGDRRPVVTTGDLDGYIFKLSPDGDWLLFTRHSDEEGVINTLWVAKVDDETGVLIDLEVENVIHFADWSPSSVLTVAFSTVEPRAAPPGWQANNDLSLITFSSNGWVSRQRSALEANSGGIYGWWGSSFAWKPDGAQMAYARPDQIGLLSLREEVAQPLLELTPLQTNSDWAWVPGLAWGPTGEVLYTVEHAQPQGLLAPEESPLFDLAAIPLTGGAPIAMVSQVGMFAAPAPSPLVELPTGELSYQVAYLQSVFPTQSDTSRYRLRLMDRDGSNHRTLFPPEGAPGLEPQTVIWSPKPLPGGTAGEPPSYALALVYQGNLWLIDASGGQSWQLTGDGLTRRMDWK